MPTLHALSSDELMDIATATASAAERLGVSLDSGNQPELIVQLLDRYLVDYIAANHQVSDEAEEVALELGSLWGTQLVESLDWQWIRVQFDTGDNAFAIGVAPRDASLVIYPFQAVFVCLDGLLPVRIEKSFQVLSEPGRVPSLPANALENVMEHVH